MNLSNHLLVAMPNLDSSTFKKSVVYICQHDKKGAMGLIINQPIHMSLNDIFESLKITPKEPDNTDFQVLMGGPLKNEQGFVMHRPSGKWNISIKLTGQSAITTSQDILESIAKGEGPKDSQVFMGYCGWEPDQLEAEIRKNDWLCVHIKNVKSDILYDIPYSSRWQSTLQEMGISQIHQLATVAGNA